MNKQLKLIENKILSLENELQSVQGAKQVQLNTLAQANPTYMQLDTSEKQITQRIAEHNNFKKTLEDMINGKQKIPEKENDIQRGTNRKSKKKNIKIESV